MFTFEVDWRLVSRSSTLVAFDVANWRVDGSDWVQVRTIFKRTVGNIVRKPRLANVTFVQIPKDDHFSIVSEACRDRKRRAQWLRQVCGSVTEFADLPNGEFVFQSLVYKPNNVWSGLVRLGAHE